VVDRHRLIFVSIGSIQLRGFPCPGSIISSHFLPRLLKLEPLFLTNSVFMSQEVLWNVNGGLTAVLFRCITIMATKLCISWWSFDYTRLQSVARLPVCLYIEILT